MNDYKNKIKILSFERGKGAELLPTLQFIIRLDLVMLLVHVPSNGTVTFYFSVALHRSFINS